MFNFRIYLEYKNIILFSRSFSRVKETYNWKMSLVVPFQRKALKFECGELKKVFTRRNFFPLRMILSSCNFRLAVSTMSFISLICYSFLKYKKRVHVFNTIHSQSIHKLPLHQIFGLSFRTIWIIYIFKILLKFKHKLI